MRFWLDLGLDGFRLDAVPYLFEARGHELREPARDARVPARPAQRGRRRVPRPRPAGRGQPVAGGRGRATSATATSATWRSTSPSCRGMFMAMRREARAPTSSRSSTRHPADPRQLPVGAVPAQPRRADPRDGDRRGARLHVRGVRQGPAHAAQPRHPPAPRAAARQRPRRDRARARDPVLAAGQPVLYYGDEIGMGDNIYLGDRDGVRTPMQWTSDRNGGFSRADFAQLYLPPLMDPVYGYQAVNVEAQLRTPTSLLRWVHRFIALRKEHPVFGLRHLRADAHRNRASSPTSAATRTNAALRGQPGALGAAGRARPVAVRGTVPEEMFGRTRFPHRRAALPADARGPRLLLVPAQGLRPGDG